MVLVQRGVLVMCVQCLVDPEQLPLRPNAAANSNMHILYSKVTNINSNGS